MSVLSLLELLVKPKKEGNVFLENRYKLVLMNYPNLKIIDVSIGISDVAAGLRAEHSIKTPDAIILATALYAKKEALRFNCLKRRALKLLSVIVKKSDKKETKPCLYVIDKPQMTLAGTEHETVQIPVDENVWGNDYTILNKINSSSGI